MEGRKRKHATVEESAQAKRTSDRTGQGRSDMGDERLGQAKRVITVKPCRRVVTLVVMITACCVVISLIVLQIIILEGVTGDEADTDAIPSRLLPVANIRPTKRVLARHAAVTADGPLCSEIGSDIMRRHGGSAVDAAIASLMCLGVVNRALSGIGGGHLMTIYDTPRGETTRRMVTISGRERAPAAAHRDMYNGRTEASRVGGLAIAVPGELAGCLKAWQMFGKLHWRQLLQPTISLLRKGAPVSYSLAKHINMYKAELQRDQLLSNFLDENGELLKEGDVYYDDKLAWTLEQVADDPWSFYNGSLAEDIVDDIGEYDGIMTLTDLASYEVRVEEPLRTPLQGGNLTLYSPQAPASGSILNFIMKLLDDFNFSSNDVESVQDHVTTYHRLVETCKFAYAKRTLFGDKEFVDLDEITRAMESPAYLAHVRGLISDVRTFNVSYYNISHAPWADAGTVQVNVLSPDGGAVSITSSINYYFGSFVRGRRTGILFNNEMDDFSQPSASNIFDLPPSPANFIEPGKAPMSSMTPAVILDRTGDPVFIFGAAGGSRITTSMAFVALHTLYLGVPLDRAVSLPRVHHQLVPDELHFQEGLDEEVIRGLSSKGHLSVPGSLSFVSAIHSSCALTEEPAVTVHDGQTRYCIQAVTDGRRAGKPAGY